MERLDSLSYEMGVLKYNALSSGDDETVENFSIILEILEDNSLIDDYMLGNGFAAEAENKEGGLTKNKKEAASW